MNREAAVAAMVAAWMKLVADRVQGSPEDHCRALFDAAQAALNEDDPSAGLPGSTMRST